MRQPAARCRILTPRHMPALSETQSISSAIEALAARYPARVAVRSPGRVLTYGELDAEANGIAGELLDRGLGVGDRVALRLDGLDRLVPAILGIFKAGGVYVPLDPTFPEARSRFVLDDCGAAFVLTDGGNGIDLSAVRTANSAPGVPVSPASLAVIVYTSGSTGEPKGVMQSHASLVSFVRNYAAPLGVTEHDRLSMLYSYGFAAANLDILTGLLHGATLCCHPTRQAGVSGLASWIAAEHITILHTLPTVFRQLASCLGSAETLESVRAVDLGGEPVTATDVKLFRAHFPPDAVLVNHYAATELSVIAQMQIVASTPIASGAMPVGFAPSGVEVRIVDAEGEDVPFGEEGEILVRSRHMSTGYWNRPELTALAFSADSSPDAWRSYRTGDAGRLRADGCLEHLGRKDSRLKIRGQSIEVAEVENALVATGALREAIVTARATPSGSTKLVAYGVPVDQASPTIEIVRAQLAVRLPDAMIPSALVLLDALPYTSTGKVDRNALPDPPPERPALATPILDARDDLEATLCRMWEEITGVSPVGVDDDFFALGGDSLGAAQLFVRIERLTGRRLPLSSILRAPTVARMAELVRTEPGYACAWHLTTLEARGTRRPLFFVHGLRGGVVFLRELVAALGPDQPAFAFEADGRFEGELGARSLEDLAAAYVDVLRGAVPDGPYRLCGYSAGGLVAFEMARQLVACGEPVTFLGLIDTYAPIEGRRVSPARKKFNHASVLASLPAGERFAFARRTLQRVARRERRRTGGPDIDGPLRRAMLELVGRYSPTDAYSGRVDVFRPAIPFLGARLDRSLGWDRFPVAEHVVHDVPGDHRTVFEAGNALALATAIERAMGARGPENA